MSDEESLGDLTSSTGSRRSYTEDEKARIYQRLNYANNIRRYDASGDIAPNNFGETLTRSSQCSLQ